jgi:hypothetical protein
MSSGNAARAEKEESNIAKIEELDDIRRNLMEELEGANQKWVNDEAINVQRLEFL